MPPVLSLLSIVVIVGKSKIQQVMIFFQLQLVHTRRWTQVQQNHFHTAFVEWKIYSLKEISQQIRETRAKLCYLLPEREQAKHTHKKIGII